MATQLLSGVARALDLLAAELGPSAVEREDLTEFADPYRAADAPPRGPAGVVFPADTEQVRAVLRVATECGVPLWTHSTGRNYGYGGAQARLDGSIALSLRRMNRVLDIDDVHGVAVVEPGVTFFDLYAALQGHPYWMSVPDLGWGSVLGNALEHGLGYTPYGEHADALCGLEVVLPGGDVVRTGTGGMTGTATFHLARRGFGPSLDGLFTQSNLGVVTRAGVWLMPEPECFVTGRISAPREADLPTLVETLRPLMLDGTVRGFPMIGHGFGPVAAAVPRDQWPDLTGPGTEAELTPLLAAMGLGYWNVRLAFYGRPAVVAAQRAAVEAAFSAAIPGVTMEFSEYGPPYTADTVGPQSLVPAGIPTMGLLRVLDPWGGHDGRGGHLDLSAAGPFTGRDATAVYETVHGRLRRAGVPAASAVMARARSLIHVTMLMFDTADPAALAAAHTAHAELLDELARRGNGLYRTHVDRADDVARHYDFGDHALHRTLRTLKDALDPAGVLSPGKQGVWPTTGPHSEELS